MGQVSETSAVRLSLELPDAMMFEEWLDYGRRLCIGSQALHWQIGDWWRHGVEHYGEEETRKAAGEIWGVESESARVYGWVAAKFDAVTRVTELPFSHYKAVASLPKDDAMLLMHRAAEEGLTFRELRSLVRETKSAIVQEPSEASAVVSTVKQANHTELEEAYARIVEFAGALGQFRPLTRRESDFLAIAQAHLDEVRAERRRVLGYRASQVLEVIRRSIVERGVSPSYLEICQELGIDSKADVHRIVLSLERRNLIARDNHWGRKGEHVGRGNRVLRLIA